jgi:Domain of unknown function (DUF4349)
MRKVFAVTILALALAAVAGCSGDMEEEAGVGGGGAAPMPAEREAPVAGDEGAEAEVLAAQSRPASLPRFGPRVIQMASLRLSLPRNRFEQTVDEARTVATGLGGFVVSSTASQGTGTRLVRGTLVLRVPERSYAEAMRRLAGLGRVEAREESGQDVSREFVDLEARRRHLEAVETQLLRLLDRAKTVAAALAVQSKLNEVQLELEQVRGQLQYLEDQVSYATISLSLRERIAAAEEGKRDGWGIVEAWERAGRGFVAVVGWMIVALATAAPVLLLLGLGLWVGRSALRRRIARHGGVA